MPLTEGTKLGPHEIVAFLGAGGMGEVYKARDTKLGREVAIKVLPEAFAENKERLGRFEREARLLASLNHPNIATLFDLQEHEGTHFLVLEFVPGETLAERIKRGAIAFDEALPLFQQIAEALEAAHEKAVIHRDLKPANVKVTPEGKVKVLDFGLAKALAGEPVVQGLSESPTLTRDATETGVLLGTAPYMSPEQARGKTVDKRTDIWAFGCCLYEALSGKTAFGGETISDTIAAVLKQDPDWQALPPTTPLSVRALLRRCLQRDANRRLHDIADARIEIEETLSEPASQMVEIKDDAKVGRKAIPVIVATALIAGIATAVAFWIFSPPKAPALKQVTRAVIPLSPGTELSGGSSMTISPDGEHVAYVARQGNSRQIYLRAIDELDGRPIDGTEGAGMLFFSPDSQWLGFQAGGKLMKVAVSEGAWT
jgi:serine/threonine protein kinase